MFTSDVFEGCGMITSDVFEGCGTRTYGGVVGSTTVAAS